ncbi:MAG TPA: DMT family transporter [Actinomycetota bacterium]|nr:DMT family transporter [Actinomycetota bacterium]
MADGFVRGASGRRQHLRGLALCAIGVVVISPDALIVRSVDADAWTTVAWRGIFTAIGTVVLLLVLRPGVAPHTRRLTGPHLFAGALFAVASIAFVSALDRTDAASVLVIIAAGPLIASVLGRVFLHQRAAARTWLTGLAVVAGLALILGGSVGQGDVDGDLLALAGATCFAGYLTVSRAARPADMTPAIAVGGVGAALVGLLAGADAGIGGRDLLLLALLGIVILPISLTLITRATHHVAAPEVNLVALLETLLGPLWVWSAVGERPSGEVLAGGLLVVGAVTIHSALALRAERDEDAPAGVIV